MTGPSPRWLGGRSAWGAGCLETPCSKRECDGYKRRTGCDERLPFTDTVTMRNAFMLLLVGIIAFMGYSLWSDPQEFHRRLSRMSGTTAAPKPDAEPGQAGAPGKVAPTIKPDATVALIREFTTFASQNTEAILSPITGEAPEMGAVPLGELKARLNLEFSKEHTAAEKARLQTAMQLAGVMEQAIAQRADHVKRRKSVEYHDTQDGSSRARVSPAEISAKMKQAEFFMRGAERKWDDVAAQYRAAINRLLASLSA